MKNNFDDIKPRGLEKIPSKSLDEKLKERAKETMKTKKESLTWKGLIVALISAALLYVLSYFLGDEVAASIVSYVKPLLELLFGVGTGMVVWGIRRAIGGVK